MDRATSFAKVARRLRDADGFDVLAFDRAGYGTRVDEAPPSPRIDGDVDDLVARIEGGDDDGDGAPVVVIGHSYGGHVALRAAIRRPDLVAGIGVFETPLAWMPWWPPDTSGGIAVDAAADWTPADAAEAFMRSIVGDAVWARLPPSTKAARRAEGPAMLADLLDIKRVPPPYDPADVGVPVTVGRGSEAKGHHLDGTRALLELLPDAVLCTIDGAGHGAHASHPDPFADFVREAVRRRRTP
jgi:pimeloyl-ACP methyl ester carboxylesterase